MRRIAIAIMSTVSGLVLLFSYHTSTHSTAVAGAAPNAGAAGGTAAVPNARQDDQDDQDDDQDEDDDQATGASRAQQPAPATPGPTARATPGAASGRFTGDPVMTRWGVVQVQITVRKGKLTQAVAVQFPDANRHDQEINAVAVPLLNDAAVAAQSAQFDSVSGATVTSEGYKQSLQSALDQAHL